MNHPLAKIAIVKSQLKFIMCSQNLYESVEKIDVQAPSISNSFGMRNLQYEKRISTKSHNKVTMTMSSYFDLSPIIGNFQTSTIF